MGMKIRVAEEKDLAAINEIYNQAVRHRFSTAHLLPVTLEERRSWYLQHDPSKFPVFVTEAQGRIAGWISLGPYRSERQALAHVAEVSYYVHKDMQGKSMGSQLLKYVIEKASVYGFSVLIAILLDKNLASIELLKKFNFRLWGRMPGIARIEKEIADHLYYGLKLN